MIPQYVVMSIVCLHTRCTTCGAKSGQQCKTSGDKPYAARLKCWPWSKLSRFHRARVDRTTARVRNNPRLGREMGYSDADF